MRKLFKVVPLFVLLVLLLNISIVAAQDNGPFVPQGPNAPSSNQLNKATLVASEADIAATNAAWASAEARAAAQAFPLPKGPFNVPLDDVSSTLDPPGSSLAGAPAAQADADAQREFPEAWQALGETAIRDGLALSPMAVEGTANVYNSHYGNYWTPFWKEYPYRTVGILRYQNALNQSYYCSASVISPNNIIVTAAHCLYDTVNNRWHKNWRFYPAERNGSAPYGSFGWSAAQIMPAYINLSGGYTINWAKYDVGLIKLSNNTAARPVTYYTGWMGRSWNYSCPQLLTTIGYPSNLTNGTRYTYINNAECYNAATDTYGQGSNFKNGSSGGPWIRVFMPYQIGSMNYVNSVVSGGPTSTSLYYMWGPRFTTNNIVWLCSQTNVRC